MGKVIKALLACAVVIIIGLSFEKTAKAESIDGHLSISYSDSSGTLSAVYNGRSSLSNPSYRWFRDGSEVSTSREYTPTETGSYVCRLSDSDYDNEITSTSKIDLYNVSGYSISLKNSRGLFEQGKTVTVSAILYTNEKVVGWRANVAGVNLPSSGGSTVSFRMPAADVIIVPEIKTYYTVKVIGGTADRYTASPGDIITVTASDVDGKTFSSWVTTGGSIQNAGNKVASVTMPNKNIQITANFKSYTAEELAAQRKAQQDALKEALTPKFSDPTRILFSLPWSNNYKVVMQHAKQGPACDLLFKLAAAGDNLVLDYFNIIINDNPNIRETPTPITACVTLPADLQWGGRHWRALCVSRGGYVYSFPDEDEDDTTVTFSPDRFYAFALCYNDNPDPVIEDPTSEDMEIVVQEPDEIKIDYDPALSPTSEEVEASREPAAGTPSASHSVNDSQTISGMPVQSGNRGTMATTYSSPLNVESDKQAAIRTANGAKIATLPL